MLQDGSLHTFQYVDENLPGFKVSKEGVTQLLTGNDTGDFRAKPVLVYKSENPRALKGKNKALLPLFWHSNKKSLVHSEDFLKSGSITVL